MFPSFFRVTAREHHAVVLMSELASAFPQHESRSLQDIADKMELSQGYLEAIAAQLKQAKLIQAERGRSGGYRLSKEPKTISIADILQAVNGPLHLVDCQAQTCPVEHHCRSKNIWTTIQKELQKTLETIPLA